MKLTSKIVISLTTCLILFCIQTYAIKCFHCNSHLNDECDDPFDQSDNDTSILTDCNALGATDGRNYTFCRKTVTTATLKPDKDTIRVIRSCGFIEDHKFALDEDDDPTQMKCYRRTGTYAVETLYCGCYADGCNTGSLTTLPGIGMTALSLIILGLSKLNRTGM